MQTCNQCFRTKHLTNSASQKKLFNTSSSQSYSTRMNPTKVNTSRQTQNTNTCVCNQIASHVMSQIWHTCVYSTLNTKHLANETAHSGTRLYWWTDLMAKDTQNIWQANNCQYLVSSLFHQDESHEAEYQSPDTEYQYVCLQPNCVTCDVTNLAYVRVFNA